MSSSQIETVARSKSAPVRTSGNRSTLTLGNQDSTSAVDLQQLGSTVPLTKSVDKIPTYYVWSVFNLIFIPFGILCCYFSHKVSQLKTQNRYEIVKKWSKRTFVLNIMTTLLMFGIIITAAMLHYDYVQRNPPAEANQTRTTGAYIGWQPGR